MDHCEHKPGCTFKCFCEQERAQEAVQTCQKAVREADQALIELRNSGVDEGVIGEAMVGRQTAQDELDAAYKHLIEVCSAAMPKKMQDVDDAEADESDMSEDEGDNDDHDHDEGARLGARVMGDASIDDDDDDDDEYVPAQH